MLPRLVDEGARLKAYNTPSHPQPLWVPDESFKAQSSEEQLRKFINNRHYLNLGNFYDLHTYSVSDYTFWEDLWDYLEIQCSIRFSKVLEEGKLLREIPRWFPGARLNYAENLLRRNDDTIACTESNELGHLRHYSFRELHERVRSMASAFTASGLKVGDRIAAIVANSITAVVLALAATSIGAIFSSTATDLGVPAVLDRYRQIQPKILFADVEVSYGGKAVDLIPKVTEVIQDLLNHGLQMAVMLPSTLSGSETDILNCPKTMLLSKFLEKGDNRSLTFAQLPFDHPGFILYSSGTSGKPKCIVHSAGAVLMQPKKDIMQGLSCRAGETFFQYTSTGWMMWTFMLATLSIGGRLILYEGSPFYPSLPHFLRFIHDQKVNYFGTSPRFLAEVKRQGINPLNVAPFDSLRVLYSGGDVLTSTLHTWAHDAFGKRVCLYSASGGTDVCGTLLSFSPTLPVYPGEIQAKALGMKIEVFDPNGKNIERTGSPGELVCTRPHPSLPICFWGDEKGEKLRATYFDTYPGIYCQGDFTLVDPQTNGLVILGRSDGVLNPSGIRFGSSEIYNIISTCFSSKIEDSICVGQRRPGIDDEEHVLLFVKVQPGYKFTAQLEEEIKEAIRRGLSRRHVPAWIGEVEDIPYNVNGKKIEIAVKKIVSGHDVQPSATIENPESFKLYIKYRNLQHRTRTRL